MQQISNKFKKKVIFFKLESNFFISLLSFFVFNCLFNYFWDKGCASFAINTRKRNIFLFGRKLLIGC